MTLSSQTRSLYLGGGSTTRFALAGFSEHPPGFTRPAFRPVRLVLAVLLPPLFVLVHLVLAGLVLVLAALVLVLASLVLVLAGLVLVGLVLILGLSRRGLGTPVVTGSHPATSSTSAQTNNSVSAVDACEVRTVFNSSGSSWRGFGWLGLGREGLAWLGALVQDRVDALVADHAVSWGTVSSSNVRSSLITRPMSTHSPPR